MAGVTCNLICTGALLILCIFGSRPGMCSSTTCDQSDIVVTQTITMKRVLGKPEFLVEVNNMCSCPQANIRLACHGFQTVETPDPAILRKEDGGSICLVNSGRPVLPHNKVSFAYAWDKPTEFALASARPKCHQELI